MKNVLVSLAYLSLGMLVFIVSISMIREQMSFESKSKSATGIVTGILTKTQRDSSSRLGRVDTYFAPVVEFRTEMGSLITYRSDTYLLPNRYAIGMELEVTYDPAKPTECQIVNNRFLNWLIAVVPMIFGTICTAPAIISTLQTIREWSVHFTRAL